MRLGAGQVKLAQPHVPEAECLADEIARQPFIERGGQLSSLVDHFNVNPQAMAIRMMALKLVTT